MSDPARSTVYLVALGSFPADLADAVEAKLESEYAVDVRRLPESELPKDAWVPDRSRWRGVFGLGEIDGDPAVMSTWRLRHGADAARLRWRVEVTAAHELGHALGLEHCTEIGCVMLDAEGGIANTDTSTGHLGTDCQRRLGAP